MRQHHTNQQEFAKSLLSPKPPLATPALQREEDIDRHQRVTAPQAAPERGRSARRVLLQQLGGRQTLRQAILLSAILGPPMALCRERKELATH